MKNNVKPAATKSSNIIPKPPLIFLSNQPMGGGLEISKTLKRIKAISWMNQSDNPTKTNSPKGSLTDGSKANTNQKATISSITISDGSFFFNFFEVRLHAQIPKTRERERNIIQKSILNVFLNNKNNTHAHRVATVPGATFDNPLPKPNPMK